MNLWNPFEYYSSKGNKIKIALNLLSGQEDYIFVMLSPSYISPLVMASMSIQMLDVVRLVAPVSNLVATALFDFLQNGTISEKDPSNRLYIASTRF